MKKQKMVSLTDDTAEIASRMDNFSQWVRIGLREYANQNDLASETMRRIRWSKAAYMLASTLQEYAVTVDPEFSQTVDDLIARAMNQTTLEEF
jgi:hypothetical protein